MTVETRPRIVSIASASNLSADLERIDPAPYQVAVIDVGSNSTRMEVMQLTSDYDLRVISEVKSLLRLASRKSKDGRLLPSAATDLVRQIADFKAVAVASGVDLIRAVATSAMRDATNGDEIVARIKDETNIDLEVIPGSKEAEYGFLGAVFTLPAHDGVLFDIGGGSVEFSYFQNRKLQDVYTLDLGALRVSDEFLNSGLTEREMVTSLRRHARATLARSGLPHIAENEGLIGTGGTIRNLAKVHRESRTHSFGRLHGTVLRYGALKKVVIGLRGLDPANLEYMPGLNPERADSILGGAIVAAEIAKFFDKRPIIVSGRGVREGLAMSGVIDELPSIEEVRRRSVYALGARFDTWDRLRADRRAAIVREMSNLLSDHLSQEMLNLMSHVARLVDTGRSVNYYARYSQASNIIEQGELGGFSHRDVGLMSAALHLGDRHSAPMSRYRPELKKSDRADVRRAASILRISDEMERRLGPDRYSHIEMGLVGNRFEVAAPELEAWEPRRFATRFKRAFKLDFVVR